MNKKHNHHYTATEIDHCIGMLTHLVNNSDTFVSLPKEKQIELMKIAGQLSRPDCFQLKRRKKAARNKIKQQIAIALNGDMGITTSIKPVLDDGSTTVTPEINDNELEEMNRYMSLMVFPFLRM